MNIDSLSKLMIDQLKDLYSAENQIAELLPSMAAAASDHRLREAFESHLTETREQISRIERLLEPTEYSPRGHRCDAMEGLVWEAKEMIEIGDPRVRDAALICAALKIEHYEIATYGSVRAYAKMLGWERAVKLIEQSRQEEFGADEALTELAEQSLNAFAVVGSTPTA
ncbi:MAG: ferritin-like domain-containing protein [Phycisphaerales bacterium]|nr:ferritin-like domain-containing protein [Phycisphaerales bacterium]